MSSIIAEYAPRMTPSARLVIPLVFAGCVVCVPVPSGPSGAVPAPILPTATPLDVPRSPATDEILRVDFEKDALGAYTPDRLAADWGALSGWSEGLKEGRASIVATDRGRSLRILYPRGSVGPSAGGTQFLVKFPGDHNDLYCSYRVRFASSFDFVRGGKLPGLVGGSHPTGGRPADDGFSARLMWRSGGAAVQYVYYPRQTGTYGVDLPYMLSGSQWFGELSGTSARFQPGVWHRVVHRVVMNNPGQADGVLEAWFDGKPALDLRDRVWRLDPTIHVDALYFSTFFGGNDPSWGATRDETVDFDDFVISTHSPLDGSRD
jgi:hypothetical protein